MKPTSKKFARAIEWDQSDIRDAAAMLAAVRGADVVFHLAAIPSVPRSIQDPVPSHEVNIDGTFNVLRACVDAKVRRVVYAASSSAYGDTDVLPKVETMLPRPKSPYAVQKLMGEHYASVFHSCFGLETVALRFFNVYGERQDPTSPYSGVLSLFYESLDRAPLAHHLRRRRTNPRFHLRGGRGGAVPESRRARRAWPAKCTTPETAIATRSTTSGICCKRSRASHCPRVYGPPREGDVRDSQADTTAARRDLGHDPQYSLEEGLRRTLAWYRAQ